METPKFKVGDRVRRNSTSLQSWEKNGDTGTIVEDTNYRVPFVKWDRKEANRGEDRYPEAETYLELIEPAPTPKHTAYTPDGVTISMELEWEIARLLGMIQAVNPGSSDLMKQVEKINKMWMGK